MFFLRVSCRSLGCKLNQLETESLTEAFREAGAMVLGRGDRDEEECREAGSVPGGAVGARLGEPAADLVLINTCTVTSKAEQKARRLARSALGSGTAVLVTGCYAQMDAVGLEALHERIVAVPGEEKDALLGLPGWLADNWQGHGDLVSALREWRAGLGGRVPDRFAYKPERFGFHSRPALKVQDGCDNRCSYCRVCLARGASASLGADEALSRARALEATGAAEIVLTGVNLSQYRDGELGFAGLLRRLLAGTERVAFRVSSFEPDRIDGEFLEVFAERRVRPHAHLPIQSGADPVLARMARPYRRDKVLAAVEALRRARRDPFIACDLISGFPGETEGDFASTMELARECRFAWIHAFPFSPRPGTRAWELRPRVPERISGERVEALTALAREGRYAYASRWIGAELAAVVEDSGPGLRGTSENYLKLRFAPSGAGGSAASPPPGSSVRCLLVGPDPSGIDDALAEFRPSGA